MSKKNTVENNLCLKINNLNCFVENCLMNEIYVAEYDQNGTCDIDIRQGQGRVSKTITFDNNKVFKIDDSDEICFIPIDGRGLLRTGHCDFVFFNEQNFCFVEMKLNATSIDQRKIEDNRQKAVRQLKNTINYFNTQLSNNYAGLELEAYIATPDFYPKVSALSNEIKVKFWDETSVDLFESREKRY